MKVLTKVNGWKTLNELLGQRKKDLSALFTTWHVNLSMLLNFRSDIKRYRLKPSIRNGKKSGAFSLIFQVHSACQGPPKFSSMPSILHRWKRVRIRTLQTKEKDQKSKRTEIGEMRENKASLRLLIDSTTKKETKKKQNGLFDSFMCC